MATAAHVINNRGFSNIDFFSIKFSHFLAFDPNLVCFLKEKNILRNDVGYRPSINSAIECQENCKSESSCKAFVYVIGSKGCFFKGITLLGAKFAAKDRNVAGPKICGKSTLLSEIKTSTLWCLLNGGVQIVGGLGNFPKI